MVNRRQISLTDEEAKIFDFLLSGWYPDTHEDDVSKTHLLDMLRSTFK